MTWWGCLLLIAMTVSSLLFPPLLIVWLLAIGAWSRWDDWRSSQPSSGVGKRAG